MNNIDRILRIVYKDIDFSNLFDFKSYAVNDNKFWQVIESRFNFSSKEFTEYIQKSYLEIYPDNYNPETIKAMILYYARESKELMNKEHICKYIEITNTILLIVKCSNQMLHAYAEFKENRANNTLEFDGILNKVDERVIYGIAKALIDMDRGIYEAAYDSMKRGLLFDEFLSPMKTKISENHMHLKGSSYIAEMNWCGLLLSSIYDEKNIMQFVSHRFIISSRLGSTKEECIRNVQNIKLIRFFLMDYLQNPQDETKRMFSKEQVVMILSDKSINGLTAYEKEVSHMQAMIEKEFNASKEINHDHVEQNKYQNMEVDFIAKIFKHLCISKTNERSRDLIFYTYLFNVYIAGISKIRFEFVQDNIGMGFHRFKLIETIKEEFFEPYINNKDSYESILHKYYKEGNVKKLEVRIAPSEEAKIKKTISEMIEMNEKLYKEFKKCENSESLEKIKLGFIIHYIKNSDDGKREWYSRWGELRALNDRKSLGVRKVLQSPYYQKYIVGIDAANYEYGCRPEVYGCLFRMHKSENKNLKVTFHVGEDFATLCNGIRAIYEAIEFLGIKKGGRLGHALSLGLDCFKYYADQRKLVTCTLQDYVDDIAWMYSRLCVKNTERSYYNETDLEKYLVAEFKLRIKDLYKDVEPYGINAEEIVIDDYIDSMTLRGDDPQLILYYSNNTEMDNAEYDYIVRTENFKLNYESKKHKHSFINKKARTLCCLYLYSKKLFETGNNTIIKEIDEQYIRCVVLAQKSVQKLVKALEIIVEANPSSNRKITAVNRFVDLPMFNISHDILSIISEERKLREEYNFKLQRLNDRKSNDVEIINDISVCINTDDSGVFQTTLNREYELVAAALLKEGEKEAIVKAYINELAEQSMKASFVTDEDQSHFEMAILEVKNN